MIHNPAEFAARFFGFAHYAVATYMLLSSRSIRNLRGVALVILFSGISLGLCFLMYLSGGFDNKLAVLAVFFFFLMHGLRDETFFYRIRAGAAITEKEYPHVYRVMLWVQLSGLCLLAGLLYPAYIYLFGGEAYSEGHVREFVRAMFPVHWPLVTKAVASSLPFLAVAAFAAWRVTRIHPHGLLAFLRSHWPLTTVLGGTIGLAILSPLVGFWIIHFVILTHFTGWFVFAAVGIAKQPKEVQQSVTWRQPDQWLRKNLLGFWAFHGGLAAIFFGLIALNHWGLGQQPVIVEGIQRANMLSILFSSDNFYYWTIFHITLSFMPRPRAKRP